MAFPTDKVKSASVQIGIPAESTTLESTSVLRIKNATDVLTDVAALTDVRRKTIKGRATKEPLEIARETLGETMKTPGDAGKTIVTPEDAKNLLL